MRIVNMSATERPVGSKGAAQLRRDEQVPCVLYGEGKNTHLAVSEKELKKVVHSPALHRIDLDFEGKKTSVMIKDLQFHPVTDRILHADMVELKEGSPTMVNLSVNLSGQAVGVRMGGKLYQNVRSLKVEGLPKSIPDMLDLDVTELKFGDSICARDIKIDGLKVMETPDLVIASVRTARAVAEPTTTETAGVAEGEEGAAEAEKAEGEEEKKED